MLHRLWLLAVSLEFHEPRMAAVENEQIVRVSGAGAPAEMHSDVDDAELLGELHDGVANASFRRLAH
jgi:hypothetical protein